VDGDLTHLPMDSLLSSAQEETKNAAAAISAISIAAA
jgi:hypothetical protein